MGKIFTKQYSPETGLLNKAVAPVASNSILKRINRLRACLAKWLGVVLLVGLGVSGWGQVITITNSSIGGSVVLGTSNYGLGAERTWTQSTVNFGGKAITCNANNTPVGATACQFIQAQASNGVIYNTTALPGRLVSVQFTGTASVATSCFGGTSRLVNATTADYNVGGTQIGTAQTNTTYTWTTQPSDNYTFFCIKRGSNVQYFTSIVITYEAAPVTPTKFAITNISPASPIAGSGFNVTVAAQNASDVNGNVSANTSFTLTTNGNAGAIGGTVAGTITAGSSSVTVSGVTLATAGTGVTLTATRTSGDNLTAGTSSSFSVINPNVVQWIDGGVLTAWYTASNWSPSTSSSAWTTSDIAQFNDAGFATEAGINLNTAALSIGAIEVTSSRTRVLRIGNNGGVSGNITFNGVNYNGVPNTILRNGSTFLFTLANNATGGTQNTTYTLANAAENVINTDGTGGITISAVLASTTSGALTKIGTGTLTLSGANSYTGATVINAGTLSISSIANGGSNSNIGVSSNAANNLVMGGGTLRYTGATASTDRNFTLNNITTSTLDVTTNTLTISGAAAASSGSLIKVGNGTLVLSGANAYTGTTTINGGTLQLNRAGGGTLPNANTIIINSGGTLQVSSNQTLNSLTLGASATLTVDVGVTLTITGTFTYNGGTINSSGTAAMAYSGTGVIIYNGSRTTGIEWTSTNNPNAVTLNGTSVVTLSANATTPGNLTINNTAELVGTGFTLTVGGDWSAATAGAYNGSTNPASVVVLNGTGTRSFTHTGGATFRNLTFSGTGSYTVNSNITVQVNAFTQTNGIVNMGTNTFSSAAGTFNMSGGTLQLAKLSTTLPEFTGGTGLYSITGGTIDLTGAGDQTLRGGIAYNNLIFSGSSGNKTITTAIPTISSVTISGGNIVDVSSSSFGGATTDFTMTAGRFRTQGTGTKPDMEDDYNLTGGVVEFYGNAGTIRSKTYQNIEVTGTNVGNSSGNITLNSGGTFTVKTGGTFSINSDAITGPTGSPQTVTIENGATFNCGNVEGLVGDALITPPFNSGAIRTNIETVDFQAGSTIAYTSSSAQKFTARSDYKNVTINGAGEKTVQGASTIAGNLTLTSGILTTTSTTPLTLTTTATTSGGSASSFVNGPLYKQMQPTSADITMPVGKAPADYKPVILADLAGSGTNTFSAEYFPTGATTSPRSSFLASGTVFSVWTGPYWQVDKTGTGINLRVGLFYDPGVTGWSVSAPGSTNRIAVARFNGSGWDFTKTNGNFIFDDPLPYVEAIPFGTAGTVYTDRIATFSPFTIGHGGNTILPVTLLRFEATLAGTDALLQWQVAPSATLSHFVVEHSTNGQSFAPMQQVAGQVVPVYSYLHSGLAPGTHYYRLKIAEKDGSYTYSATRQVTFTGYAENMIVQWLHGGPGHAAGQLTIYSQKPQAAQALLIDMAGRVVKTYPFMLLQGLNNLPVHLPALASGIYRLRVTTSDGKQKLLPVLQ